MQKAAAMEANFEIPDTSPCRRSAHDCEPNPQTSWAAFALRN
jgi:hypothetical protein